MSLIPEIVTRLLERIDARAQTGARCAVVLGERAEPWADLLRHRGYEVVADADTKAASLRGDELDLVLAVQVLERAPWDRWMLQKAHLRLRNGGHLVLAVPSFHAMTSPGDLAFLGGRAVREVRSRARARLGLPPARDAFRGRRYRARDLDRMIESLGFTIEQRETRGHGWLAPLARAFPRPVERLARTHVRVCRRGPSLFGLEAARPFPDPEAHRRAFERDHRQYLAERDRWVERNPRYRPAAVRTLDPSVGRDRNVLVLAPHPDDELIGCGGTVLALMEHGARVTVVQATDGCEAASLWHAPPEERRTVRLEEARRVGEALGFESVIFWREDNSAFHEREERVRDLAALLSSTQPALVFTPFVTDVHPDHRVLSRMLAKALRAAGESVAATRVLSYQVWSLLPPNLVCDITRVAKAQERALLLYETAMKVDDYVHFCQDRNYYDAVTLTGRPGFVEAFFEASATEFPELMSTSEETNG